VIAARRIRLSGSVVYINGAGSVRQRTLGTVGGAAVGGKIGHEVSDDD